MRKYLKQKKKKRKKNKIETLTCWRIKIAEEDYNEENLKITGTTFKM